MNESQQRGSGQGRWAGLFFLLILFVGFPVWCSNQVDDKPGFSDGISEEAAKHPVTITPRPPIKPEELRAGIDELRTIPIIRKVWWVEGYDESDLPKIDGDNTLRVGVRNPSEHSNWDLWAATIGCGILANHGGAAGVDIIVYDPTPNIVQGSPIGIADCDK